MNTAPNSPWKGYYPNVNPFGISERYDNRGLKTLYDTVRTNKDESIKDNIKPTDRDKANIEAEKGEVLLTFKGAGQSLYKIQGKKHEKGGTPLRVEEGSFIFSDNKDMALSPEELETFDLGKFQKGGAVNNTPAKVLNRNIDVRHNNKMLEYLDKSKNFAEKNTAYRMLQKYNEKVATIAALQEMRKPNEEVPDFAYLPPPNIMAKVKEEEMKQYRYGGNYLPKANDGTWLSPIKPSVLNMYNTILGQYKIDPLQNKNTNASSPSFENDFSWIKPYDSTPSQLSMLGNTLMGISQPRIPGLALQTAPPTLRAQNFNAEPGVSSAMAQAYAARKAANQYSTPQLQTGQMYDTQAIRSAQDYNMQVDRANLSANTEVQNKNLEMRNQTQNINNQALAQFQDKVNELRQNMSDNRRNALATNLNIMGENIKDKQNYDMSMDYLKRSYPYNVAQNSVDSSDVETKVQMLDKLKKEYNFGEYELSQLMKYMFPQKQPYQPNPLQMYPR